ncbi:winged helix-turn-helix domain-containing protein [Cellulomonas persica]|uniref:Transcriptional regulator n=1 Tax=Cellulomonas persica TaxID=76861 RepID=A0A510UPS1_9CELL|nr:helix-turn-helix domain-containing protein [Cellulomonas persica]GEK16559.1 transcriptional regulator [Cellulomonas persica]
MLDVAVIDDPAVAEVALDPTRARLLAALTAPGSATTLAADLGLTRQQVNYHLRTLESHGLATLVDERRRGNMTERVLQASAASYVISPGALPQVAPDPERLRDQLSAQWMLALGARLVHEVGTLLSGAQAAGQRLATYAVDGTVRFASAADRARFADELGAALTDLIARYDAPGSDGGRDHRLVVALHPALKPGPGPAVEQPTHRSTAQPAAVTPHGGTETKEHRRA